jgi:hypothetical protein
VMFNIGHSLYHYSISLPYRQAKFIDYQRFC